MMLQWYRHLLYLIASYYLVSRVSPSHIVLSIRYPKKPNRSAFVLLDHKINLNTTIDALSIRGE